MGTANEKGYFFSFCGLDGAGKTTHANLLKRYLEEKLDKKVTIIPGYKPPINVKNLQDVAKQLNVHYQKLFTSGNVTMSLLLDLWMHTKQEVLPRLEKGEIVISERYWESSILYAPILGVDKDFIEKIVSQFITPDLFIYLNISPEKSYKRVVSRSIKDQVEIMPKEQLEVMEEVYSKYNDFAREYNAAIIDIDTDDANLIFEKIRKSVDLLVSKGV
ncbi:dTMP kinase [Bacillus wiedmannii]|uniref:dTMP kinase n=1 Tax=Bacillus wiedmannii TaxID=1890302 RepID=UPI000BFBAB3B|nr:dTMP kinase [Bacillus wiedmannii]PHE93477.1 dTMP kinase [Bacillus wiedmannii]